MSLRARLAVALWLVALVASGYWIARHLSVTTDLSAFLPPAATRVQEVLVEQLRAGVASRLLLIGIEGADEAALAKASRELAQRLDASGAFGTVANGEPERLARERERLFALRYALSPGVRAERFSTEGLRAAMQEELEVLASPLGMFTSMMTTCGARARTSSTAACPSAASPTTTMSGWSSIMLRSPARTTR